MFESKSFHAIKERYLSKRLIGSLIAIILILSLLGSITIVLAKTERGVQYFYNDTLGLRKIYKNVLSKTNIPDVGICACQPDKKVQMDLPGGFKTTAFIYERGRSDLRPGIVLVHGNTWMGQNLSTYRLIGSKLAEQGFIVLTFDMLGFGESDDPFGKGPSAVAVAYDHVGMVNSAIEYLIDHTDVEPENISVFGHSGGAPPAMASGRDNGGVSNIIIIGSPLPKEDSQAQTAQNDWLFERFRNRYKFLYQRSIPDWFTWDLTGDVEQDPEELWNYFRQEDHKPLILVLPEEDKSEQYLKIYDSFTEPKGLVFIERADHLLNTAQSLRWVFFDREITRQLVEQLVPLLEKEEPFELKPND